MNSIKEIGATESYLSLDQDVRGCQTKEPLHVCTTRLYIDTLLDQCKCIPFNIKESDKEIEILKVLKVLIIQFTGASLHISPT